MTLSSYGRAACRCPATVVWWKPRVFSRSVLPRGGTLLACLALVWPSQAQWVTQSIPLARGWNAVYLLVQPEPRDCDTVFAGLGVETVWKWDRKPTNIEFDLDPNEPFPRPGDWSLWFPEYSPQRDLTAFSDLLANQAYLIKLAAGAPATTLILKGRPVVNRYAWQASAYGLYGFGAETNSPPLITDFFALQSDIKTGFLDGGRVYTVQTNGLEQLVYLPQQAQTLSRGKAYWILSKNASTYGGPLSVSVDTSSGLLDFGTSSRALKLRVKNVTATNRTVLVRHKASLAAPAFAGQAPVAGAVPLLRGVMDWTPAHLGWTYAPLPDLWQTNLAAGAEVELDLRPDPLALTNPAPHAVYQSVLAITDKDSANRTFLRQEVGVRYEVGDTAPVARGGVAGSALPPGGLWVGQVAVTGVSTFGGDASNAVQAVSRPFPFRVLLAVNTNGTSRLLQEAYVSWQSDTNGVGTPLLFESSGAADAYLNAHPDATVRRLSAVNFPFVTPVGLTVSGVTLTGTVPLAYNDPVNPFYHRYAPDHDNLQYNNGVAQPLADGVESYSIARQVAFTFSATNLLGGASWDWGLSRCGGTYRETVSGLMKRPVVAEGYFELRQVLEGSW